MLAQIITENGQKKIKPLTADAGAGNPVGTIIVVCSNQIPSNYLPLGTQYDTSLYPVLYALLGTDTTPTASSLGLPTLSSGQYAIKATSGLSENAQDNVVAQLKEYSNNQNLLSDYETFTLTDTNQQMQYDGFLLVRTKGTGPWGCTIYVNDIEVSTSYNNTVNYNTVITVTIPLNKGENVRYGGSAPDGTKARFYKLRDYTGR